MCCVKKCDIIVPIKIPFMRRNMNDFHFDFRLKWNKRLVVTSNAENFTNKKKKKKVEKFSALDVTTKTS